MKRARIVDVDYHEFSKQLELAVTTGGRVEKKDRDRWKAFVRKHDVKEASCMVHAKDRSTDVKSVIIDSGGSWDGYYVYSPSDQFCLKFQPADAD